MVSRKDIIKLLALLLIATLFLVACERPLQNAGQTAEELATQVAEEAEQAEEGVEEAEATSEPAAEEEAQEEVTATEPAPTEAPATDDTPEAEETPVAEEEGEETGEEASPRTGGEDEEETPEATEEGAAEGAEEEAAAEEPDAEETADAESEETAAEEMAEAGAEEEAAEEEAAEAEIEEEAEAEVEEEAAEEETAEEEAAETTEEQEATEAQTSAARTHVVQPGENLYRIGLQYGISWVVLADYNNIRNPDSIYVGQELLIPPSDDDTEEPTPTPTPSPATETTYIVKPGDNLYRIGRAFNISWVQIAEANGIVNPNHIVVGQELKIPAEAPGPAPQFTHTVRQGETLFTISLRYGVSWTTIAEANDLTSPYVIYPGQTLVIPGG